MKITTQLFRGGWLRKFLVAVVLCLFVASVSAQESLPFTKGINMRHFF